MTDIERLKQELTAAMILLCDRIDAEMPRYKSNYFRRMVNDQGGYQTAVNLLASKKIPDGLATLIIHGRLDLSMETLVLEDRWNELFNAEQREIARKRLK